MKIIENTSDRLVLTQRPGIISCVLALALAAICYEFWSIFHGESWGTEDVMAFLVFIGMFGGALAAFTRFDSLTLDRKTQKIHFKQLGIFNRKSEDFDLNLLEQASTQMRYTSSGEGGDTPKYRIALILKDHPIRDPRSHPTKDIRPASPVYIGGNGAENGAKAINLWLKG